MATIADMLREIHRLRQYAKELQAEIERGPRRLKLQKNKITLAEEVKTQAQDALKRLKVANHDLEVSLKSTNTLIAKHERQLNEATSKKEYDALKAEILAERTKSTQLEDEILSGMMQVDEKTAQLPELDKAIQKTKEDLAEFERSYEQRQAERKEMLQKTEGQIKEVEGTLPEDIRLLYERQLTFRGEDAMAAVDGSSCRACYTGITAQNMNELRMGKFVTCKSCGRILYLAEIAS